MTNNYLKVRFTMPPAGPVQLISKCDLLQCGRLLDRAPYADAVLVCNGSEIKVHREILDLISPVFPYMFGTDYERKLNPSVQIDDVDFISLQALVRFL